MRRLQWIVIAGLGLAGCQPPPKPPTGLQPTAPSTAPDEHAAPASAQSSAASTVSGSTPPAANAIDPVLAHLDGRPIKLDQLQDTLLQGYGLKVLLNFATLQLTRERLAKQQMTVGPADVAAERDKTLSQMFADADKSDYPRLLDQFLKQKNISEAEFNLVLQTNAGLRKIAEPLIKGKITDDNLQLAFRERYGETVQVRVIELANLQEVIEAKRRLGAGDSFANVAQAMSRNARSSSLGGEIQPFSRNANLPQAFKDAAFALKDGEVSDAVQAQGSYFLIKLERRIPPKGQKFEDVKESLRGDLTDRATEYNIKQLRAQITEEIVRKLQVENPILKGQYEAELAQQNSQIQDRTEIRKQLDHEREQLLQRAATQPAASAPMTAPAASRPTTRP